MRRSKPTGGGRLFAGRAFLSAIALAKAERPTAGELTLSGVNPISANLLNFATCRDGDLLLCRSGFTPDMPRKDVGDKPRPTVGFSHSIARDSAGIFWPVSPQKKQLPLLKIETENRKSSFKLAPMGVNPDLHSDSFVRSRWA
jgi:hypothetical protein